TDETLSILRYNSLAFIDPTFQMALALFIKCLIMMVYDLGSQLYMPCACSLKLQKYTKFTILYELLVLLKYTLMPSVITIDFKKALKAQ
ncbi:LOW QUALITY PROTEIN: hypothetical protein MXB_2271, partial [Myxobolus squamalis]